VALSFVYMAFVRVLQLVRLSWSRQEDARRYAENVVRFMELSEKMTAAMHQCERLTPGGVDAVIVADLVEPVSPDLLRQYQEQSFKPASAVPTNFG